MNKKHYVGRQVASHEWYDEIGPITGVALLLDEDNEIIAGDESGYLLEIDCKYGTQEMADNILASINNKTYKGFRSTGAILSPTAELGDGIAVDGDYSFLAYRAVNFGPGHISEIAAPGESTQEYEYQYKNPSQRKTDRKLAQTRSLISKSSEEILLKVENINENLAHTLRLDAGGVYITDAMGNQVTISGGQIDASKINAAQLKAEDIDASRINAQDLVLSGCLQFSDFDASTQEEIATTSGLSDGTTIINGSCIQTGTIKAAYLDLTEVAKIDSLMNGTTIINGGCIKTGQIKARYLDLTGSISFEDFDSSTQYMINNAVPSYIQSTYIDATVIKSPTIEANEFSVYPSDEDDYTGSFNIWGMQGDGQFKGQYHMLAIQYTGHKDAFYAPTVDFYSPANGILTFNDNQRYGLIEFYGTVNFNEATTKGLYLRFS